MNEQTVKQAATWEAELEGRIPPNLEEEIEIFETQMAQKRLGQIDDKVFAETRLRRGVYGQRYDNGQRARRHRKSAASGVYAEKPMTKGPDTVWDAPGMVRIKIPFGGVNRPSRLEVPWPISPRSTRTPSPTSQPARTSSSTSSTSTTPPTSCAAWRRSDITTQRGLRQLGPQRHCLPAGRASATMNPSTFRPTPTR